MPTPNPIGTHVEAAALKCRTIQGGVARFVAQRGRVLFQIASQIFIARLPVPADSGLVSVVYPFLALLQLVGERGLGQVAVVRRDTDGHSLMRHAMIACGLSSRPTLL